MIPKICANCAYGNNIVTENNQIALTNCFYLPITVTKRPDESCGCFSMSENPQVSTEEENVQQPGSPDVEILEGLGAAEPELEEAAN